MRKLASIQRIEKIDSIPDADKIEVATIEGWKVVVAKDQFKVGDLCIYFEIDSLLPPDKFPEVLKYNPRCRIRTVRLRGQISQGMAITLDSLFEKYPLLDLTKSKVGDDLTEILGVVKYEPPIKLNCGLPSGSFPSYIIPKTDEDRIQSNKKYFKIFEEYPFVATVKYDGTSATFGFDEDKFFVASHNLTRYDSPECLYWNIARKYKLDQIPKNIVIQGEICGPGIQKNKLELKELDLFVFIVYDQERKRYLSYEQRLKFCKEYNLKHVDLAYVSHSFNITTFEELLDMADGFYPGTKNLREGIVFEIDDNTGERISFKVISNKFLLKYEN